MEKLQRYLPLISLVLFCVALAIVHHEVSLYHWSEILSTLTSVSGLLLLKIFWLTIFSYLVLSLYDYLGLLYTGEKLPYRCILLTSFLSYSFSNNIGHGWISGGSLRYRLYSGWGLPATSIARIIIFCTITFALGVITLLVAGYAALPNRELINHILPAGSLLSTVSLGALVLVCWWFIVLVYRKSLDIRGFSLTPPSPMLAVVQTAVGVLDMLLASAVLYIPLSQYIDISYGHFIVLYVVSMLAGILSMVPGGIGIFEGSFLFLASVFNQPSSHILAALIIYRTVYYFVPLVMAGMMLAAYEFRLHHILRTSQLASALNILEAAIPQILAVLLLLGGTVLLFSGATPGEPERLKALHYFLPLPLIEFSHLIGSVTGVVLLFLARAVSQRLQPAYYATIVVLGLGVIASLAKGWDFEEATVLSVMLLIILPAKKHFYRKSGLVTLAYPSSWIFAVIMIVTLSVWLGFFSYKHVDYSHELWWQFSVHGDAPRFLRSLVAIAVVTLGFAVYRFLYQHASIPDLPDESQLEKALALVRQSPDTMHYLAMTGDKRLLWSESGKSFIMFGTTANYWVAMGDPIGDSSEFDNLAWKFRELADRQGARVAFYEIGKEYLPAYLDLGLTPIKLGEEARVPLAGFGLEGKKRQGLRHTSNKAQREGYAFEIITQEQVASILPDLRLVSEHWMQDKQGKEKRFSVGFFDEHYLLRSPIAIIRKEGKIVAFANLWAPENRNELSMDLMRYDPENSSGVMEYLTIELMLWGKQQGYTWFNLGMAPLSGLERHPLAPLWHKVGDAIFRLSNEFYNFEGLYQYKNKFDPIWQPRYFAVPGGLQAATALFAVTSLISGGIEGVVKK